ncbi:Monocarboxylate transporter 10 [Lamellibrachia satsuma]|nr:Monocarboxylate transporter 10 [Lamellibrachia satsuma]
MNNEKMAPPSCKHFVPPDGGWGWVVCWMSFWTNSVIFGLLNTFGIIYVEMLREFDNGEEDLSFKTSWVGALQISMTFLMSPIVSVLVDLMGIRTTAFAGVVISTTGMFASSFVPTIGLLYITYGLLTGLGISLVYIPSMIILGHYFKRHLGVVNGIVVFGSAVSTMILPFVLQRLLVNIGLQRTMRIMSGLLASQAVCALTWKPLYSAARDRDFGRYVASNANFVESVAGCSKWLGRYVNTNIWRNRSYTIWVTAMVIAFTGYFVPFAHLVKHTRDVMPDAKPEVLIMVIGAASGISRLLCGKISDLPGMNRVRMQQAAFCAIGICTACIPLAHTFTMLVVIVAIMGFCDGCFICMMGPIAFDLLGTEGALQGLGAVLGLMAFPMTIGPPVAGLIYDLTKSYDIAFYTAGVPPVAAALFFFLMPATGLQKCSNNSGAEKDTHKDDIEITVNGCVNPSCGVDSVEPATTTMTKNVPDCDKGVDET